MFYSNIQSFAENQQNVVFEFFIESVSTSLEKLRKIYVIFILRQGMFR